MGLEAKRTGKHTSAYEGFGLAGVGKACSLVHAGNYCASIGNIAKTFDWRVERQKHPPGVVDVQIQRNGAKHPSTIACCLVPEVLSSRLMLSKPGGDDRSKELSGAIQDGLRQSAGSRRPEVGRPGRYVVDVFEVRGDFSA